MRLVLHNALLQCAVFQSQRCLRCFVAALAQVPLPDDMVLRPLARDDGDDLLLGAATKRKKGGGKSKTGAANGQGAAEDAIIADRPKDKRKFRGVLMQTDAPSLAEARRQQLVRDAPTPRVLIQTHALTHTCTNTPCCCRLAYGEVTHQWVFDCCHSRA